MSRIHDQFSECERAFQILKKDVLRDQAATDAHSEKWERTLSALSQGRYDSADGLLRFIGELYGRIESLTINLKDADAELKRYRDKESAQMAEEITF